MIEKAEPNLRLIPLATCVCRQMALQSSGSCRAGKAEVEQKSLALSVCWVPDSFVLCLPGRLTEKDAVITALQEELREVREKAADEVRLRLHPSASSVQTTLLLITG